MKKSFQMGTFLNLEYTILGIQVPPPNPPILPHKEFNIFKFTIFRKTLENLNVSREVQKSYVCASHKHVLFPTSPLITRPWQ